MFLRSKKTSFLSTGSFFQTLGKFNHQTFKKGLIQTNAFSKSLTKNAAQASQKESVLCEGCLMMKQQKGRDFIIGGCNDINGIEK